MKSRLSIVLLILVFASVFAFGQTETGSITGTVTDPTGAVVSGATVTATDTATGQVRAATTGASGSYTMSNLRAAPYEVVIEAQGFAKFRTAITVTVASVVEVSAKMAVTSTGTTVEVTAGGSGTVQVETQSSELSQEVSAQQVAELPSLTRNPYDFVNLAGNTTNDMAGRGANGAAINGQRSASTDILLDGGENVDLFSAALGQQVPQDSVQEFRVTTSDFNAEYGRASGGIVNVATKSGTNAYHGSAYEFNRLSDLASNTYDNNANDIARPVFTRNQFGFSAGGPVIKNKLFFFGNAEWLRVRSTATNLSYVPDPGFIALTNANTQAYFAQYGALKSADIIQSSLTAGALGYSNTAFPLVTPTTPVLDLVSYGFPADVGGGTPENTYNVVGRVDFNLNEKTQMFGRYTIYSEDDFPGTNSSSAYSGWDTGQTNKNQNVMYSLTHLWSNNLISNSKISLNRLTNEQPLGTYGTAPGIFAGTGGDGYLVPGTSQVYNFPGYLPYAAGAAIPFGGPQNVIEFDQSLSWIRGKHSFKFGGESVYIRDNREFGAYQNGYQFLTSSGNTLDGTSPGIISQLLTGGLAQFSVAINPQGEFPCFRAATDPNSTPIQTPSCTLTGPATSPSFSRSNRYKDAALYAQDSWKIYPRLTLNLGLRWEYYGVQHAKYAYQDANVVLGSGNIYQQVEGFTVQNGNNLPNGGRLWAPQWHNFGPRVGFAYDIFGDGKTSLRGGYGIAYERNFGNVTYNVIQNPPNYATLNIPATPANPLFIGNSNFGAAGAPGTFPFPSPETRAVATNIKPAYANIWNLSVEREVARNTVASVEYSGSRGIHGYVIEPINDAGTGPSFTGLGCGPAGGAACLFPQQSLNLQYGHTNYRSNGNDSWHDAMNAKLTSSNLFKQGINLTANYTWSHTIDNSSATFAGSDEVAGQALGTMDPFVPAYDRGDSDFDTRNHLALSAVWILPYANNTHGIAKQALDGWEFTPIVTAQSGYPYTIFDCTNNPAIISNYFDYDCGRYIPGGPVALKGSSGTGAPNQTGNPNQYIYETVPVPLVYGNSIGNGAFPSCSLDPSSGLSLGSNCTYPTNMTARNAFRQPGQWNANLGIYKNFKVTERIGMQFRSEFYNLFNHSNYYTQTGNIINNGGTTDVSNLLFGSAGNCAQLSAFGAVNGTPEYYNFNSATGTCTTTPATYQILGKKGVTNQASNIGTGSLGERRYVQLALRITF
ncbi:MAG: carboxypeptidase regulatory-like domain-containing protein [Terriglobales bacterium]